MKARRASIMKLPAKGTSLGQRNGFQKVPWLAESRDIFYVTSDPTASRVFMRDPSGGVSKLVRGGRTGQYRMDASKGSGSGSKARLRLSSLPAAAREASSGVARNRLGDVMATFYNHVPKLRSGLRSDGPNGQLPMPRAKVPLDVPQLRCLSYC